MRNRNEFVQLIDRYRLGQAQRLTIGVSVAHDFSSIHASLVLAEGRGKFLRTRWIENRRHSIPDSIGVPCREAISNESHDVRDFSRLRVDLTRTLATATSQLAVLSGNHSTMLMVVAVDEPGLWIQDYDSRRTFQPFCEPTLLAELTGLTVVDALPCRDLAAGGRGWPVFPLPHWLIFGDRDRTIAEFPRLLVSVGDYTELTWLPESDGLDREIPAIRFQRLPGQDFEQRLLEVCGQPGLASRSRDEMGAQGKVNLELAGVWSDFIGRRDLSREMMDQPVIDALIQKSKQIIKARDLSIGDVLRTLANHVTMGTQRFLDRRSSHSGIQLVAGGQMENRGLLMSEMNLTLDRPWMDTSDFNYEAEFLNSATVAISGLMHVDQMPQTVPWLTGSEMPRVLGRLTPGSPANWRRVIMDMGDCRPPVMKLRDAV